MGSPAFPRQSHLFRAIDWTALLLLCLLGVLCSLWAAHAFGHLDPRFDQAWNALASRRMAESTHFLPARHPGDTFARALEADPKAWLSIPARLYAVTTIVLLDATSIVTNWLAMLLFGHTYAVTIYTSIAASCLTSIIVFVWTQRLFADCPPLQRAPAALAGGVLVLFCAYRHYQSPWGAHNFAVFFLTLAAMLTANAIGQWEKGSPLGKQRLLILALAHLLALYSYSTNLLLLGIATPLALLCLRFKPWRFRLSAAVLYLVFAAAATGFIMIREYPSPTGFEIPNPHPIHADIAAAIGWFAAGAGYYSPAGFLLALLGLVLLATRLRVYFPLALLGTHFLLWTFMRTFTWNATPTGLRTFNYVLPLFALGGAATLGFAWKIASIRWRTTALLAIGALLCSHFVLQLMLMHSQPRFIRRIPLFYDTYLRDQGAIQGAMADVDRRLPPDAMLMTGDGEIATYFDLLTRRPDLAAHETPPLSSILAHASQGDLRDYLSHRRPTTIDCHAAYALVDVLTTDWGAEALRLPGFGCGPVQTTTELGRYTLPRDGGLARTIELYRLQP